MRLVPPRVSFRKSKEQKRAMTTFRLDEVCDELEKAQLRNILDRLKENEAGLIKGAKSVREAIQTMDQIEQALDTLAQFAEIAAKIVALQQ